MICYKAAGKKKNKRRTGSGSSVLPKISRLGPPSYTKDAVSKAYVDGMNGGKKMPHKAERCFVCKEKYESHGKGKDSKGKPCKSYEFVAVSARNDRDILFAAPFASESSAKVYSVQAWRQGDYSCNCTGWRNYRTCKHIEQVAANPQRYKKKTADAINAADSGSIVGTVDVLTAKMTAMEAAVKRGDSIEIAQLQAEIDLKTAEMEAAGAGLAERFAQVQANIKKHLFGGGETKTAQPAPVEKKPAQSTKVVNSDDPFGDL
jgi:hypothetical protein